MNETILIVDDSATIRLGLRCCLEAAEYTVVEAKDGAHGVDCAREHDVNLIIVDVNMPVMDGLEMLEHVRRLPNHTNTPAFVLSSENSQTMVARGKAAGAKAWIVKPFDPNSLLAGIRQVLAMAGTNS